MADAAPLTAVDAAWEALRDDVETWLAVPEDAWRIGGVVGRLVQHRPLIEAAIRSGSPTDAALPEAIDRLLAVEHRDDDQPCSCDECMSYGAEDAGADWYRIPAANRVAMRILDGADDRLAELAGAFRDHDAALRSARAEDGLTTLRALSEAATPGPWTTVGPGDLGGWWLVRKSPHMFIASTDGPTADDLSLAAAAVNYVRAALAALPSDTPGSEETP